MGDVFDVLMSHGLPVLFTGTFFGQQAFNGFPEEVAALSASVAFSPDDERPSGGSSTDFDDEPNIGEMSLDVRYRSNACPDDFRDRSHLPDEHGKYLFPEVFIYFP